MIFEHGGVDSFAPTEPLFLQRVRHDDDGGQLSSGGWIDFFVGRA